MMQTLSVISKVFIQKSSARCKKIVFFIASFIATGCFVGKIKYAPGTFGSLLAIFLCPYFVLLSISSQLLILSLLFTIGYISVHFFLIKIGDKNKDPKEVVIDEIAAVFLMSIIAQIVVPAEQMDWKHFFSIFVLFRFFDIVKPYPISFVDKNVHGATGIMIDDIMAGIAGILVFIGMC